MSRILPPQWTLPDRIKARLGDEAGRQRPMLADGHLLLILHAPPGPDDLKRTGRLFWRDPQGVWKSNAFGSGVQALRTHLDEFDRQTERLDQQLDRADAAGDYFRVLQAIAPLFRTARHLHAVLQQAREMCPDERDLITLRDRAGDLERTVELLQSDAKNALDFKIAEESEEQSQRNLEMAVSAHRLNLLAAIFLPLATISSIFGMNLVHPLDGSQSMQPFWIVLAAGFGSGILLTLLLIRRPREYLPKKRG